MRLPIRSALLLAVLTAPAAAQSVPTPVSHFGFEIGTDRRLATWQQLSSYYAKVAQASPRVTIDTLGPATRGQPFVMLTITSPENHARLDELQQINLRLADPRTIPDEATARDLIERGKTIVLITQNIHSTEVGAGQMAANLVYRLASSDDPKIREILDNVVLLHVPSLNPDGTQWVTEWYNQSVGTPAEGTSPPWLYQYYTGHDNNRDWYAFTQVETQYAIQYGHNAWHPQIVHDVHQMGGNAARIFTPPYIDPAEPNIDPALIGAVNQLGMYMAAELLADGKTGVVSNGIYDMFTPARAYQHYHAGARILTETASANLASPVDVPADRLGPARGYDASRASWNFPAPWPGGRWTLGDIVDYQETAAVALLSNAARNRRFWLQNFYDIGKRAVAKWPAWPHAWVIPAGQANQTGVDAVIRILRMGDVEVQRSAGEFTAAGRTFPSRSYIIPMNQPYASFAQTMLERQRYPDLFEYPGGPPARPYDVTAHTLPLLMNVEAVAIESPLQVPTTREIVAVPEVDYQAPGLTGRGAPRIAMYKGWTETMPAGWTRWVFDQHGIAYDTLKDARVRAGNLRRDYDVIVFQDQDGEDIIEGLGDRYPEQYRGGIGTAGVAALQEFVRAGGRLVAVENATEFATDLFDLPITSAVQGLRPQDFYIPGAILRLDVDTSNPIGAALEGLPASGGGCASCVQGIAWYWNSSRAFDNTGDATVIARYGSGDPRLSGWVLGPEHIAGKPAIVEAKVGNGSVVLFGFQPNYRAQTIATWPLLFAAMKP